MKVHEEGGHEGGDQCEAVGKEVHVEGGNVKL